MLEAAELKIEVRKTHIIVLSNSMNCFFFIEAIEMLVTSSL